MKLAYFMILLLQSLLVKSCFINHHKKVYYAFTKRTAYTLKQDGFFSKLNSPHLFLQKLASVIFYDVLKVNKYLILCSSMYNRK